MSATWLLAIPLVLAVVAALLVSRPRHSMLRVPVGAGLLGAGVGAGAVLYELDEPFDLAALSLAYGVGVGVAAVVLYAVVLGFMTSTSGDGGWHPDR